MAASVNPLTPCVVYAAKSTEDLRESIPDQLRDCRSAIERDDARYVVAEYSDEAFSGFLRSRGPDLVDAMQHVEDLARDHGTAELWAQHSDRLARGDGRSARHTVELALWALKRDVRVRTVQDPDTFRDLLYAVVTGQRNHEDSKRKGASVMAGWRRSAERGSYLGNEPDGYKLHVEIDARGKVKKSIVIDPDRRQVIEMIFRMSLRGKNSGQIARAVNKAGWRTNPPKKDNFPRTWTVQRVLCTLKNPRYAGLSAYKGEILARDCWPAYITERQHVRIQAALRHRPSERVRKPEPFLLARLAVCGRCGSTLVASTRYERVDGTWGRTYVCVSKRTGCHVDSCDASVIQAEMLEALFVSALPTLLIEEFEHQEDQAIVPQEHATSPREPERQRLIDAVFTGEDLQIDAALDRLLTQMSPETARARRAEISYRRGRELEAARAFEGWAEQEKHGRTDESRAEALRLNRLLRTWFASVTVEMDETSVDITAQRRASPGVLPSVAVAVHFDRREQARLSDRPHRKQEPWCDAEIVGSLEAWADKHGQSPRWYEWRKASPQHPMYTTVLGHFGTWSGALSRAGLVPTKAEGPRRNRPWTDDDVITAMRAWAAEHGHLPEWQDWLIAAPEHPCAQTVVGQFGGWQAGLAAARPSHSRRRPAS